MTEPEALVLAAIALASFVLSYVGAAVGLVLGQLRVVLLCSALGDPAVGIATSLAVSTAASVYGAYAHLRAGRVAGSLLLAVGVPSALCAYGAARLAAGWDGRALKLCVAAAVVCSGLSMLLAPQQTADVTLAGRTGGRVRFVLAQAALGAALGAISGVVGLLLGSLRLPAMVRLSGVSPRVAVGTNVTIGALTGFSAGAGALVGGRVHLAAFAIICPITLVGAHFGARKAGTLDAASHLRWIAWVLLPTGLIMLAEGLPR